MVMGRRCAERKLCLELLLGQGRRTWSEDHLYLLSLTSYLGSVDPESLCREILKSTYGKNENTNQYRDIPRITQHTTNRSKKEPCTYLLNHAPREHIFSRGLVINHAPRWISNELRTLVGRMQWMFWQLGNCIGLVFHHNFTNYWSCACGQAAQFSGSVHLPPSIGITITF